MIRIRSIDRGNGAVGNSVWHHARRRDIIFKPLFVTNQPTDQRLRHMTPCFNDWKRFAVTFKKEMHQTVSRLPLGGLPT
jgi:hypothetical protein